MSLSLPPPSTQSTDIGDKEHNDAIQQVVLPDEVHHAEEEHVKEEERYLVAVEQHLVKGVSIVCQTTIIQTLMHRLCFEKSVRI